MNDQVNNPDTKWMGGGLLAAFTASVCCIIPVIAVSAGMSGIASAFSWLEPFRPWFIALTVLLLGFAWYQKLKPHLDPDCACEEEASFWQSKGFLGIVTVLAGLLLTFPSYSGIFFPINSEPEIVYVQEDQVETFTLDIEGMTCAGCEASVEQSAKEVDGVLEADASYEAGTATIKYDRSKTSREEIKTAINKSGYTVIEQPSH